MISTLMILSVGLVIAAPMPQSFAPLVVELTPAVVNINTEKRVASRGGRGFDFPGYGSRDSFEDFFGRFFDQFDQYHRRSKPRDVRSLGSGFIISADGYILTNNHVISQVQNISVGLWDGRFATAQVVGSDPETDLAVLKIELGGLPTAPLAEEANVRVGDVVLAKREGIVFIPAHLAEKVVTESEAIVLRDMFGHMCLKEGKYTPGQIDGRWSPEIQNDFRAWLKKNINELPVPKEVIEDMLNSKTRNW